MSGANRPLRALAVVSFAVSLVLTAMMSTAAADDVGTVSGTVTLDGQPLPDVEVFLWVGFPRLTCTDSQGEFMFADVPFNVSLVSATGPGSPEHCKNFWFRAPGGTELLTQFYEGHDGVPLFDQFFVTPADPNFVIDYTPRRAAAHEKVCVGQLATVVGTTGDDVLAASPGANVVYGDAGNDIIEGHAGPFDLLCGGPGNDRIYGYGGPDTLVGGPGIDRLYGGGGIDVILGGGGRDILRGQAGNDIIWGFGGNDTALGGQGRDVIRGNAGDDVLRGNLGWDRIYGGPGIDTAYGGPGKDKCWAETEISC